MIFPKRLMTSITAQNLQGRHVRPIVYNGLRQNFLVRASQIGLLEKYEKSIMCVYKEHDYYRPLIKQGFFLVNEFSPTAWFIRNSNEPLQIHPTETFLYWSLENERSKSAPIPLS